MTSVSGRDPAWPTTLPDRPPVHAPAAPPLMGAAPEPVAPSLSPASRPVPWRTVAMACAAAVVLVAVAASAWLVGTSSTAETSAPSPTTAPLLGDPAPTTPPAAPPTTVAASPEQVAAEAAALSQFVEQQRGLTFRRPVAVTMADNEAFDAALADVLAADAPDIELLGRQLAAVGLVSPSEDVVATMSAVVTAATIGYYVPGSDTIVVRGTTFDPLVRRSVVHELVHALDDQWFDLDRPEYDDAADERAFGLSAVAEGNAVRIHQAWVDTLDEAGQRELNRLEAGFSQRIDTSQVPAVIIELLNAPYILGADLLWNLNVFEGEQAVDRALSEPPTTSSAVLWPERYLAGFTPVPVAVPPADGEVFDQGMFGEWMLRQALGSAVGVAQATSASRGWRGDAFVGWVNADGNDCVRVDTTTATAAAADTLDEAVQAWVATLPDASSERLGPATVRFTTCAVPESADGGSVL